MVQSPLNEKISETIQKYIEKSNDYNDNRYCYYEKNLKNYSNKTLAEMGKWEQNNCSETKKCCK